MDTGWFLLIGGLLLTISGQWLMFTTTETGETDEFAKGLRIVARYMRSGGLVTVALGGLVLVFAQWL